MPHYEILDTHLFLDVAEVILSLTELDVLLCLVVGLGHLLPLPDERVMGQQLLIRTMSKSIFCNPLLKPRKLYELLVV